MLGSISRLGRRDLVGVGVLALGLGSGLPATTHADRISLRGGGQIRGKLIADKADPGHLTFIGEAGRNPIIYKKEQILQVTPEPSALDEYVDRRGKERTTAEDEYQLGVWAEEHKLADLAAVHFEAALKLDPAYAPAHEKLGHVFLNDRWLDADGLREAQGMVKYRGRWMMPEEKDRLEDQAAAAAESQSWLRRVRGYRDAYVNAVDARAKEAERRLLAIREVAAVGPVARVLGDDANPAVRALGGRVLGGIDGPEASAALVLRLLNEGDDATRERLLAEVGKRERDEVLPRLVRALRSPQAPIVNRAAWTIGQLNARAAVPQLIPALMSTEYQTVMVPSGGTGNGGNGMNSGTPAGGVGFSNYTGSAYLGITPPVVGPGVVAYGAVGVPYGSGVSLGTGGGVGGGSAGGPVTRVVAVDHPNVEVLGALVKLTGQDFGYDTATWRRWAASSFRSDPTPARRVAQP